jgi:DHA2 family methylenomycin A resistance protein-like MFS transporter
MSRTAALTIAAAGAAAVMIGMDFNGVAVVLTQVERDLGTDLTTSQWMLNLYALTFGMGIVAGGKLGDTYGYRRMLLIGLAIFGLASLGVAVSQSVALTIGFRGIQGVGGALIWPAVIAISFAAVPPARAGFAIGTVLGAAGFGNVLGPLLGGTFAELATWRLLFVVNIPACLIVGAMAWRLLRSTTEGQERRGLDLPGVATLALALFALMFSLDVGADWGWSSPGVIALWMISAVLFVAFLLWEPRSGDPLIPPELLRDRGFVAALLANGLVAVVWFSFFIYVPGYAQKALDYSPLLGAVALLPAMVTFAVLSPLGGRFYEVLGPRRLITIGYVATTLAALNMAIIEVSWGYWGLLPGLLLMGTGGALAISSAGTAAVAAVDEAHAGSAGGLSFMFHLVVGAAGVAIGTALFTTQASGVAVEAGFVDGFHVVFWFGAAVAAAGIVNARFIRTTNVRMQSA